MQKENNKNYDYDVVIIGGGTAGCSCAWNCSQLGLRTLLVEQNSYLGGAMSTQFVVPAMKTNHKDYNTDFFEKLCEVANEQNAQITYIDGNKGWFNPLKLPTILCNLLKNTGCDILLSTKPLFKPECIEKKYSNNLIEQRKILSLYIDTNYIDNIAVLDKYIDKRYSDNINEEELSKNTKITSKYFIDATGDANLSAVVGAEFLPNELTQALSLRFIMNNVDKKAFLDWILALDKDRNVTTGGIIEGYVHFSTAYTWDSAQNWALKPLFDDAVTKNILKDTDRAYFQIFSIAGEDDKIAFNCPRIISNISLNPLLEDDIEIAKKLGTEAIERIARFCNLYFRGFENANVYKIADNLGVRESRRVKGKYILTKEDIYNAKEFENPVAYSNYPIDIHSIEKDSSVLNYVQKTYTIPLESLIVDGFDNLFVIGRCISADFYAQAAVRIQPTCFSMGEGLAKYLHS